MTLTWPSRRPGRHTDPTVLAAPFELYSLTELTVELGTSTFAGALMLQAMGLGGWMLDGIDSLTALGASGQPDVPGHGFRYDQKKGWPLPNPTGLEGAFESHCPLISRTCEPLSRQSPSGSSALEVPTIRTRRGRGKTRGPSVPAHRRTMRRSSSASERWRSISLTSAAGSQQGFPASSASCTSRLSNLSSMTGLSPPRIYRPMRTACRSGIPRRDL